MAKLAIRVLILSMFTTSLLVAPAVTPADAATTNSKHMKKKRVSAVHQRPKAADPYASSYSNNPYENDFDRKNAGGGGGY